MADQVPVRSVADELPSNFAEHSLAQEAAEADRRYMLQRRDQFSERLLLGSLTVNGASLVALFGVLGSETTAAALGFTPAISLFSAGTFVTGIVLAGYAANQREVVYIEEASDAGAKSEAYASLCAHRDLRFDSDNSEKYGLALDEIGKLRPVGYQWSGLSITAQHWAGGVWLAGIIAPLWTKIDAALPPFATWWPF